jgi:hypothetical protein
LVPGPTETPRASLGLRAAGGSQHGEGSSEP